MLRCLALALSVVVVAQTPASAQPSRSQQVAIMDSIAESPVIEGRVAGLTAAVIRGADTLLMKGYGMADLEWQVPMTVEMITPGTLNDGTQVRYARASPPSTPAADPRWATAGGSGPGSSRTLCTIPLKPCWW